MRGRRGRDRIWQLDLQLPVQSVPITTKILCSNPLHGQAYSIQHYVIKVVSNLRQVGGFSPVSSTNTTDRHDITTCNIAQSGVKHHNPNQPISYELDQAYFMASVLLIRLDTSCTNLHLLHDIYYTILFTLINSRMNNSAGFQLYYGDDKFSTRY